MKIRKSQLLGILAFFVWMPIPMLYLDPPEFLAGQPLAIYAVALFFGGVSLAATSLWTSFRRRIPEQTARIYVFLFVLAFVGAYQFSGLAPSWQCFGKRMQAAIGRAAGQNCQETCTNNKKKPCSGWSSCWDKFVSCNSSGRDQDGRGCQGCCFSCTVVCEDPDPDPEPTYQPPTISAVIDCSQPGNDGWCVGAAVLTLTASDPQNFSVTITGDIDGSTFACAAGAKTCTRNLPDGNGTINYKVTAATSSLTAIGSATWKQDRNFPTASLAVPPITGSNGWFKTAPVVVSVSGLDDGSGLAVAEMSVDAGTTWQSSDLSLFDDGSYVVHSGASDIAGNRSDYSGKSIRIDTVSPVISPSITGTFGSNGWLTSAVDVDATTSDATSGVAEFRAIDGKGNAMPLPSRLEDGIHKIELIAVDLAGNTERIPITLNIDTVGPSIAPMVEGRLGTNGWYVSEIDVDATASDLLAGLEGDVEISLDRGSTWVGLPLHLGEGSYILNFRATDKAGNTTTRSLSVDVDTTAPVIRTSITGTQGNDGWYLSSAKTTLNTNDEISGVDRIELRQNTEEWHSGSIVVSMDGVNDISFRAYDLAGNVSSDSVQVKVDTGQPQSTFTIPLDHSTDTLVRGLFTLSGNSLDIVSGIMKAEISFDGKSWFPVTIEAGSKWHYDWDTSQWPDGIYRAVIRATDVAGNREAAVPGAQVELLVNNAPPHIKLTPEWMIWESGALSIRTEYFRLKDGKIVIADTQGRWPSVEILFDEKYPTEIQWDRRFGNGVLAPSGDYRVKVTACNIYDLCSQKQAIIKIPWYAAVPPTLTVPATTVEIVLEPQTRIGDPPATAMPPTTTPHAISAEQTEEPPPGKTEKSWLLILLFTALLCAISSAALADTRPAAVHAMAKTIKMQITKEN